MISYSTNWMGPINMEWIRKNGDCWAAGRIDVRGVSDPYGDEINLPAMHREDWYRFSEWLRDFQTYAMWTLEEIVEKYEKTNPKIRWFKYEEDATRNKDICGND